MYLIIVFILLLLLDLLSMNFIKTSYYEINSDKIPKVFNNYKILQLSDLHSKVFNKNNKILIDKIMAENPDIIVMTGDMVNSHHDNFDTFLSLCEYLSRKFEIYYICGNHEESLNYYKFNYLMNKLKSLNINILYNKKIELIKNNENINLYGLCMDIKFYKNPTIPARKSNFTLNEYSRLLGDLDKNTYNILLAHNPLYFDIYSKLNIDLILSGHVHGGIIRLPLVGGLLSPERKLFPKYSSGLYKINNCTMLVNRGLGNTKLKFRLFNAPEISLITLCCT